MLDKQMCGPDLAIQIGLVGHAILSEVSGVVLAHIVFQSLAVCIRRRLPSRLFGARVEVVRKVLAVGVPDLLE